MKRLIAYTSVSHMGFVLLGLFAGSGLAFQGAMIQIVSHGLSTGALFILAGALQERLHTRSLSRMGGLWPVAPRLGGASMFFALASLGLPGMGNFVGEFMVVLGVYPAHPGLAVAASLGLHLLHRLCPPHDEAHMLRREHGRLEDPRPFAARDVHDGLMMAPLLWLGLSPQPLIDRVQKGKPSVIDTKPAAKPHLPGDTLPPERRT